MAAPHSLHGRKQAAREVAFHTMAQCDPALGHRVGAYILPRIPHGAVVAGFWPMRRELDMTPLLRTLRGAGHVVALPRTPARGLPLTFHRWGEHDALLSERFGTTTCDGPEVLPEMLLVPLLAFDRHGHRLGYGGGYYDRTLAALINVQSIGCAYAALELQEVPTDKHDRPLQAIATEHEFITVNS